MTMGHLTHRFATHFLFPNERPMAPSAFTANASLRIHQAQQVKSHSGYNPMISAHFTEWH